MPRDLPLGNGSLLVNFDSSYQLRDVYWPHVGQENHTAGHPLHFGVWVGGQFRDIVDPGWQRSLNYREHTLVTEVALSHPDLPVTLECHDAVDFHENLYLRQIVVRNHSDREQEVRLFFGQDFHVSSHAIGDSAYYEPERRAVFHYKGKRWFLVNCGIHQEEAWLLGLSQWSIGKKEEAGSESTWRDADDGELSGNAVAQGSVDSCVALHLRVPPQGEATGWYWIAVGEDFLEVTRLNRMVRERGPESFLKRTDSYWALWCTKDGVCRGLPKKIEDLYQRSLLILRTQIDDSGAVIAATDFDIARAYSDTYAYMWPRDGALAAAALIAAGYGEATRGFFRFCHEVITPEGYLLHKYNPDGSLASSWQGWDYHGRKVLPVQEDETALVIWALWRHFERFKEVEFIKPLYRGLIIRSANWLVSYRDGETGLPLPSWNLWEERRDVSAWTIAAVWGGLQAAANFAEAFGEDNLKDEYRQTAASIREAALAHLWNSDQGRYVGALVETDQGLVQDTKAESSLSGMMHFGMVAADDERLVATMEHLRERLWIKTDLGGVARYEDDHYQRVSDDVQNVPGNPWFICTLWLAQWYIAKAKGADELQPAKDLLNWVADHALQSGVMAEQVNPYTGAPVSVSPLTWSHGTLVTTVQEYLVRRAEIAGEIT